jgi:phosphonate transport system substrate-binding protein
MMKLLHDLWCQRRTEFKVFWSATLMSVMVCGAAWADTFSVGIVPQFEPRKLAEIWTPILIELENRTGHQFVMKGSPEIPEFEHDFIEGAFDFAYMNPYHFLVAAEAQGYYPVVRDGGRELFGVLVVAKDSDFQTVADLEGRKIAFPAPNALGAALLMRADLDRIFGISYDAIYVSTHSSAYLNVALGEMDAAGGVMATFNTLNQSVRDRLRIIYETTRVPPHPVVAHKRVDPSIVEDVRAAFLAMGETEDGKALLAQIPIRKVVAASADEYEILNDLQLRNYWVDN